VTYTEDDAAADELEGLIVSYQGVMIAPIRQELLSGIRAHDRCKGLHEKLRAFPGLRLRREDYQWATRFFNRCHGRGVQGSNTDFLICPVGVRRDSSVFSIRRVQAALAFRPCFGFRCGARRCSL
jgi:hypothetical protein